MPRSPRWLIYKLNDIKIARRTLARVGGDAYADATLNEIQRGLDKKETEGQLSDLLKSKYATIMIIALGIAFFNK